MEKKRKNMNDSRQRKVTMVKILKKIGTKSLIFFTITAIVLIGTIFVSENDVYATSKTQDEAINWLYSVEGHPFDVDGAYGIQCADLAMAYYEYLGEARPYGNGCDYFTNALPPGWERYANTPDFIPEPGDVVSWDSSWGGGAGHVAIVLSATVNSLTVMEQNGTNHTPTHQKTYNSYSHVQGFNRPNFTENDNDDPIINRVWIEPHNHTELMLKVTASDSNGISEVRSYHKRAGLPDWHMNYMVHQDNDEWWIMLRPDDGYGDYDLHIYVRDNAGNETFYGTGTGFGRTAPSIKNYDVIDLDSGGFTITGEYNTGDTSLESFQIPVWTTYNAQDDLRWETPDTVNGNRFYKRINFSEHNNERGLYNIHMYLTNKATLGCSEGINGYAPVYESVKTLEKDGHIYALYDNALSWENAKKKAEEFGGHLATIDSEKEQAIVDELLNSGNKKGYWLGGYKDNQWKWITNEDFSYDNWAPTQPDNAHSQEDKLMAFKEGDCKVGEWNDAWNEDYVRMGFIIEYEPQLDNAVVTKEQDKHIYKLFKRSVTWDKAKAECESLGGHLMTVTSDTEQKLLAEMIGQADGKYWLGGKRNSQSVFEWITGESMAFTKWALGQPDNNGNNESVMGTFTADGNWNDFPENYAKMDGYILEIEQPTDGENKSIAYNGKKYIRYDIGLPWTDAQKFCESKGGNLAMVKDSETQNILKELAQNGRKFYFLGLTNLQNNTWKWLDNTNVSNSNWDTNEPNNTYGIEHYVGMVAETGKWWDFAVNIDDMTQMGFICEVPYEANVEQVILDKNTVVLKIGETTTLTATVLPEDAVNKKIIWSSSNEAVATVKDGVVTAKAEGEATITVTAEDSKKTAACKVSVSKLTVNIESVSLNKSELLLNIGDTSTLSAVVKPDNASNKKLKWDSNNTGIATVDQNGKVTAIAVGQTKITATSVNGKQGTCTVTVNEPEATDQLRVVGSCDKTVRPGDTVTIMVSLENYDISEDEIATLQIEVPNETNELSYIADSKKLLLEGSEFAASDNIIFAYLPFSEGANTIPKDKKDLFSFQMKASDKITDDMDAQLPITITMGNQDDTPIMQDVVQNITVPIRKSAVVKGDLNGSGGVDIMDARKAKRAAMKEIALTDYELQAGDLNSDGKVDIIEARRIKRAAMKETEL